MFFPFQGTFFLSLGVAGGGCFIGDFLGVCGSLFSASGLLANPFVMVASDNFGVDGGSGSAFSVTFVAINPSGLMGSLSEAIVADVVPDRCCTSACFKVSLLDRVLGYFWCDLGKRGALVVALGVFKSLSSNHAASSPEIDPLNEEFSLSPAPSLSQCRASALPSPAEVCWRIQSSVRPLAGRRALLARMAALTKDG